MKKIRLRLLFLAFCVFNVDQPIRSIAGGPSSSNTNAVTGVCGSSNAAYTTVAPSKNLCSAGTASAVTGRGPWLWSCLGSGGGSTAQCGAAPPIYPVAVSGRHLVDRTGTPFMIIGDSPQAIINIPPTGPSSMDTYFRDRAMNGFNSLWINLICSSYTACPVDGKTYDGIPPFTGMLRGNGCPGSGVPTCYDLTTENPAYFARMDSIITKAGSYGFLVFLDPISTDGCGGWMQTLIKNGAARTQSYGAYLGKRYKSFPNVVWMSGNDFQCWTTVSDDGLAADVVRGMQSAGDTHLQTSELNYEFSSSKDDTGPLGTFITLNGVYSYLPTYDEVQHAYNQASLPVFLQEANYELANSCCEPGGTQLSMEVLRKQEYWTMLSGATGQLYASHYSWTFASGWAAFLDTPGVTYLLYMKNLFASLQWYNLVPDQDHTVMTAGYGTYSGPPNAIIRWLTPRGSMRRVTRWVTGSISSSDYATTASASSASGTLVVAYIPTVRPVTIDMTKLGPKIVAKWYDPTSGIYTIIKGSPFVNTGSQTFTPSGKNSGDDTDWVLILQGGPLQ